MRISSVGAGNMATAILTSVVNSGRMAASDVTVYDIDPSKYAAFRSLGIGTADSIGEAVERCDVLLLAVKPQDYESVLLNVKNALCGTKRVIISIAAAISTSYICKVLDDDMPVVRVMPNTPLLIGYGATAVCRNAFVDERTYTKVCSLFAASGSVVSLDESLMNPVISVNSSSPAYVYLFAKAMIDNAVTQGIPRDIAEDLVYQTLRGSAEMLIKSGSTPDELIRRVASPKGTTLAALESLDKAGFCKVVSDGMDACTARAEEIAR